MQTAHVVKVSGTKKVTKHHKYGRGICREEREIVEWEGNKRCPLDNNYVGI